MGVGARNAAATDEAFIQVRGRNVRGELAQLKEFDPNLYAAVRKELKRAGESVVRHMGAELDKPPLGLVTGVSKKSRYTTRRSSTRANGIEVSRRQYVDSVETTGARGRSGRRTDGSWMGASEGGRADIKRTLRVTVPTAKAGRAGIRIVGPKATGFAGAYNKLRFRHPVFADRGSKPYVDQAGRPYFGKVVVERREELARAVIAALDEAIDRMNQGGT